MPPIGIIALAAGGGLVALATLSPYRVVLGFNSGVPYPLIVRKVGVQQNGDDALLERDSADAFEQMQQAAMMDGVSIYISSAYRSFAHQALLFVLNMPKGIQTAKPGWSNHQQGLALDIDVGGANYHGNKTYLWLLQHAGEYGFRQTVGYEGSSNFEPWHWSRGNG